jgi:hypothetical protein
MRQLPGQIPFAQFINCKPMSFMGIRAGRRAYENRLSAVILPQVNKIINGGLCVWFHGVANKGG